ncbi:MAG: AMP-binding protein [Victivallales bacterium]|nr:AMP-binding protein [Victivallales bacterium]
MQEFDCRQDLGFLPKAEIHRRQTALFNAHLRHLRNDSPYYREALAKFPDREYSLEELQDFPITDKSDFTNFGQQFIAVPREQIADLGFTSGTTGMPCQIAYTKRDLARLAYSDATGFLSAGMKPGDRVLLTCTMDRCFIAGLAYFSGVMAMGATGIRNGLNTVESHAEILMRLKPEGIVGVPSFLARLVRYLESNHLDCRSVRTAMCIGEPLRRSDLTLTELGEQLNSYWPGAAHSTYAASETQSSFAECAECAGGHAAADLVIPEILDQNGNRLPNGEIGEIVLTPLQVEGLPLLRFRTGDMGFLIPDDCACGRNTPRLGPIVGRKAQLLKVHGTSIYPATFTATLDDLPGVEEYYLEITGAELSDEVTVCVARDPAHPELTEKALQERIATRARVKPRVRLVSLEEARLHVYGRSRKPTRFFDLRNRKQP